MAAPKPHTHCLKGHPLTPDNVYKTTRNHRRCVICKKAYGKEYKRKLGLGKPTGKKHGPSINIGYGEAEFDIDFNGRLSRRGIKVSIDCILQNGAHYRVYKAVDRS